MYRTHTCGQLRAEHVGQTVTLSGWVHKHRNLGGLMFVDMRDRYGRTQVVFDPEVTENYALTDSIKYEYIIKVTGTVEARESVNVDLATGAVEVKATSVEILSKAKPMPFEIFDTDKGEEDEELRLKYRFLEIRRERLKNNILFRNKMIQHIHGYMQSRDFVHVETPLLTVSSPEGARDFLVPSRIHPGKFYALPQAPQQYKQLLMVGGLDRYYQIAPCMRDEDPRADRAPGEFYQLDCETSFLTRDEFFELMEPLFVELTEELAGKQVQQKPFPRIPYKEAIESYGVDRPDLRFGLKIQNVTEWGNASSFNVFSSAEYVRAIAVPGAEGFSRKEIDELEKQAKRFDAKGLAWMKYAEGTFDGGVSKFFSAEELEALKEKLNISEDALLVFVADNYDVSCKALGAVRAALGEKLELADPNVVAWAWVVDFPFFEWDDKNEKIDFGHNPFSMPQGGMDALMNQDPLTINADQYDIIANGLELSSGAVRNKDPEIMYKAFEIAGYDKQAVDDKFGHMIAAFEYGAPPHCGFAPGIDRLVMLLTDEKNIRGVIPFPKNQKAEEPMMGSPSVVDQEQLDELSIAIDIKEKN
jgi:aspartyl-tRNA synthetase